MFYNEPSIGMVQGDLHKADDEDGSWITMNGTHVHLNTWGEVDKGPAKVGEHVNSRNQKKDTEESKSGKMTAMRLAHQIMSREQPNNPPGVRNLSPKQTVWLRDMAQAEHPQGLHNDNSRETHFGPYWLQHGGTSMGYGGKLIHQDSYHAHLDAKGSR